MKCIQWAFVRHHCKPLEVRHIEEQRLCVGSVQHRLPAQVALGRRNEDDRDHYANKRLDLGGPLLAGLFRHLFRKVTKDVRGAVQRAIDKGGA